MRSELGDTLCLRAVPALDYPVGHPLTSLEVPESATPRCGVAEKDLLAPVVYGRSLQLHPVVVLLAVAAGGALFGIPGTLLAVPVTAVVLSLLSEARSSSPSTEAAPTA